MDNEPDKRIAFPVAAVRAAEKDVAGLRALTLKERGEMVLSACRTAALIRQSRVRAGLPDVLPAPWPKSTLEFLRKHARHGQ